MAKLFMRSILSQSRESSSWIFFLYKPHSQLDLLNILLFLLRLVLLRGKYLTVYVWSMHFFLFYIAPLVDTKKQSHIHMSEREIYLRKLIYLWEILTQICLLDRRVRAGVCMWVYFYGDQEQEGRMSFEDNGLMLLFLDCATQQHH